MRTLWLADVLRAANLYVVEEPGWQDRGYDFPGGLEGVVGHHTASNSSKNCPSISTLINGRPDLNGPLAQIGLCRDGVVHVIAAGVANHAGSGSYPGILLGNKDTIGIEAENNGIGEAWPEIQMEVYVQMVAALLEKINRGPERFCTHYEWTDRKIDAGGPWIGGGDWYDGGTVAAQSSADVFRSRVEDAMAGGMTEAQEAKLDKVLKLLDDYFGIDENGKAKDIRLKIDSTYIQVEADDHEETLAGRVNWLVEQGPDEEHARRPRNRLRPNDSQHKIDD